MKTTVLIIAHNEERYIGACIESLLRQSRLADEVILVVHNSVDKTLQIAREYPISVVPYDGPAGISYARQEGLRHATGEQVFCIDGDSRAHKDWLAVMGAKLNEGNILVGSWVRFEGTLFDIMLNAFNRYCCAAARGEQKAAMICGASFAFWGKDKALVRKIWEESLALSKSLQLSRHPEDYWLALYMNRQGSLGVTASTWVTAMTKESTTLESFRRNMDNINNGKLIRAHLKSTGIG